MQKLACHLENEQYIIFPEDDPQQGLDRGSLHTTLTAYFLANGPGDPDDPEDKLTAADRLLARTLTYADFPSKFTFLNRRWHLRKSGITEWGAKMLTGTVVEQFGFLSSTLWSSLCS